MAGIGDFWNNRQKAMALDELWRRVENAPKDPRIRLKAGDLLQRLGRYDAAVEQYREAFTLFTRQGFEKQARAARSLILRLRPDDSELRRAAEFPTDLDLARTQQPLPREIRDATSPVPWESPGDVDFPAEKLDADLPALKITPVPKTMPAGAVRLAPNLIVLSSRRNSAVEAAQQDRQLADGGEPMPDDDGGIVVSIEDLAPTPAPKPGDPVARPRDRRVETRIEADGVVKIWNGRTLVTGTLEDLSTTGIFVSGPVNLAIGSIVDVALRIPDADWVGTGRARVMRNVEATKRRAAGIGLAFLWADAPTERWIEETIVAAFGHLRGMPAPVALSEPVRDDVRRAFPRSGVCWPCVLRNDEFEVSGWVRDLSEGGAFVEAPRVFGPGRRVEALLWLPGAKSPLVLQAVIAHDKRPIADEHRGGTGVRFVKVDDEAASRLRLAIS